MIDADFVRGFMGMSDNLRSGRVYYPRDGVHNGALAYTPTAIRRSSLDATDTDAIAAGGMSPEVERIQVHTANNGQPMPGNKWRIYDAKDGTWWVVTRATRTAAGAIFDCLCTAMQGGSPEV